MNSSRKIAVHLTLVLMSLAKSTEIQTGATTKTATVIAASALSYYCVGELTAIRANQGILAHNIQTLYESLPSNAKSSSQSLMALTPNKPSEIVNSVRSAIQHCLQIIKDAI